jgi:two-component system phosphate regulon response regulator PhoB
MRTTETNKHILIVDRDVAALETLRQKLSEAGFVVRAVAGGADAAKAVADRPPHLVIIDWDGPGFMALDLIQVIRATRVPQVIRLIILSALAQEQDVVAGLNFGADDYIAKPFSPREVTARVAAVLRSRPEDARPQMLSCGTLVLDASTKRVTARGKLVNLRGIEYRLLEFLMANIGRTFNRTQLLARVWGDDANVDERTVDVNVQRLRKILSAHQNEDYVQTVRGFGYRFAAPLPRG